MWSQGWHAQSEALVFLIPQASHLKPKKVNHPLTLQDVAECIERAKGSDSSPIVDTKDVRLVNAALLLATLLQKRAARLQTPQEKRQQAELDRMLQHPEDKAILTQITDQSFRSSSPGRVVDQMVHILDVQGVPRFFSLFDQALLKGFQSFGEYLPGVAVPLVKEKMRKETANVILPAEHDKLTHHLQERSREGIRMNVNFLGEAILGEEEARRRLEQYLAALQLPEIECVSAKISTMYSQVSPIARRQTVRTISDRLELLYRAAARERFTRPDGSVVPKFVYLDMEEYRDLSLTSEIFIQTLSRPGMEQVRAGIALQAYVPDSFEVQKGITAWARDRVLGGGAPITIRIVKGANMEMERVEASLKGWPQAPYTSKLETDANYKRMLRYGLEDSNHEAVHLGIASHNLFDLAYGMVLAYAFHAMDSVQFEMLEGMANHQRRAMFELSRRMLLYAPACKQEEFINAIGYLVRRLDENTGPDNFLRHAFHIDAGGATWKRLENGFVESVQLAETVSSAPRRKQDRNQPPKQPPRPKNWESFTNEPDTDFSLLANTQWAQRIIAEWESQCDVHAPMIPVSIGDREQLGRGPLYESRDPSRPGVIAARYHQADEQQLRYAIDCASVDPVGWRAKAPDDRYEILRNVAQELRIARGDLIGSAIADAGKTILESDPEVSEAIDFVEFYARCALDMSRDRRYAHHPAGVVVVISPWNFPIAIPCGGIAAALAAGNTVLLKPASDTVLPAYRLCQAFWSAGVPREALQFVPCSGESAGKHLLSRPEVARVILTGGTETALRMLHDRPDLRLLAETGGKNATIVSGLSDHDLAIKNVLHSAFSHSGQKCSATSLLLLDEEIFENKLFREQLIDAARSMRVGSAWDLSTKMGPLIRPPSGELLRGLKELELGETWALMPTQIGENPCLYSPAIKWNTRPGSFTHRTELFGPVLGVMKYKGLEQATRLVNETGYGLTSGLESLDDREQAIWKDRIAAGNLYINRSTTGAIVLRQPFGGMGKSAFGLGAKAGGPNYVATLVDFEAAEELNSEGIQHSLHSPLLQRFVEKLDQHKNRAVLLDGMGRHELEKITFAIHSYDQFAHREILAEHDHFRLLGQDNVRRYLPASPLRIRVECEDTATNIFLRAIAAASVNCRSILSAAENYQQATIELLEQLTLEWAGKIEFVQETDEELAIAIERGLVARIRYGGESPIPEVIRRTANLHQVYLANRPVHLHGCIELLNYVVEQSISFDYHRYGNLGNNVERNSFR